MDLTVNLLVSKHILPRKVKPDSRYSWGQVTPNNPTSTLSRTLCENTLSWCLPNPINVWVQPVAVFPHGGSSNSAVCEDIFNYDLIKTRWCWLWRWCVPHQVTSDSTSHRGWQYPPGHQTDNTNQHLISTPQLPDPVPPWTVKRRSTFTNVINFVEWEKFNLSQLTLQVSKQNENWSSWRDENRPSKANQNIWFIKVSSGSQLLQTGTMNCLYWCLPVKKIRVGINEYSEHRPDKVINVMKTLPRKTALLTSTSRWKQ